MSNQHSPRARRPGGVSGSQHDERITITGDGSRHAAFVQEYPAFTTREPRIAIGKYGRIAMLLDGTKESAIDQIVICALTHYVPDVSRIPNSFHFVELMPTTVRQLAGRCCLESDAVQAALERLETQHRIFIRGRTGRGVTNKMVIQVGVGPLGVLFAPALTPEFLFNASSRAYVSRKSMSRWGQLRRIYGRMREHAERIRDQAERTRLLRWLDVLALDCGVPVAHPEPDGMATDTILRECSTLPLPGAARATRSV